MCSQEAGWMLGHTLGFYHPQHLVPACHTPSYHALPYIQCLHGLHGHSNLHMDKKFKSWDPGSHSTQLIKEQVLNPITRPLCWAFIHRMVTTWRPTISFTKMILLETLHLIKFLYPHFGHKHSYTNSVLVISRPVELLPGVLALNCAADATMVYGLLNTADIHFPAG